MQGAYHVAELVHLERERDLAVLEPGVVVVDELLVLLEHRQAVALLLHAGVAAAVLSLRRETAVKRL